MSTLIPIKSINNESMAGKLQPTKGGYNVAKSDLYSDSTGRSAETGALIAYIIRRNVYTIELEYVGTAAQIAQIEALIDNAPARRYSVEFLDNGTYVTKTMYPSDRQKSTEIIIDDIPQMRLSFTFVEV